jgi:hypothetical protein
MADLPYIQQAQEVKITGQGTTGTTVNYVGADANGNMTTRDAADGTDGATAPTFTIQIGGKDLSGNLQSISTKVSGEQYTADVINIAGQNRAQSVTTTAAEALGGATILANRKVISITPTNGIIYWGFTSSVTTATGTPIFTNQSLILSFTDNVHVYLVAAATTDVRIAEGS